MSDVSTAAAAETTPGDRPVVARTREELATARAALTGGDVAVVMTMGALHEGHATLIRTARQSRGPRRRDDLPQPAAVRAARGPVALPPHLRRRPRDLPRRPASTSSSRRPLTSSTRTATPACASPPGPWATSSRARPAPATSTGCSRSSPSCCTSPGPTAPTTARRTPSSCCSSGAWCATSTSRSMSSPSRPCASPTGLAMSSRNTYLTASDREVALCLSRALRAGADAAAEGPSAIRRAARAVLVRGAAGPDRLPRARAPDDPRGRARVVPRRGPAGRRRQGRHDAADRQHRHFGSAPAEARWRSSPTCTPSSRRPSRSPMERTSSGPFATPGERAQRHDLRLPARLAAPGPGWTVSADVIVAGSGIAGLTTALRLRSVSTACCSSPRRCSAPARPLWAQGGIAAALAPGRLTRGAPARHARRGRRGLRRARRHGPGQRGARPACASWSALGAEFDLDAEGELKLTREGGHRRDRIAHAGGDATGREISRALIAALEARAARTRASRSSSTPSSWTSSRTPQGRVCGVTLHVIGEGQIDGVGAAHARAVVLATGGLGQVYSATTNPSVATGDGMAAALRAGAVMADLEFVQFHPTVLWLGEGSTGQQPLISEAVRGEGAFLVDRDGVRFMQGLHPPGRPRTARRGGPRDRGPDAAHGRGPRLPRRPAPRPGLPRGAVSLDRGPVPRARLRPGEPTCCPWRRPSTTPRGGIRTDLDGRSSLDGLYACGEVSCTGVHGANRLASNSLLEGLVFAHRIADDITERIAAGELPMASPCRVGRACVAARRLAAAGGAARDDRGGRVPCDPQRPWQQRHSTSRSSPARRRGQRSRARPRGRRPTCCTSASC